MNLTLNVCVARITAGFFFFFLKKSFIAGSKANSAAPFLHLLRAAAQKLFVCGERLVWSGEVGIVWAAPPVTARPNRLTEAPRDQAWTNKPIKPINTHTHTSLESSKPTACHIPHYIAPSKTLWPHCTLTEPYLTQGNWTTHKHSLCYKQCSYYPFPSVVVVNSYLFTSSSL